MPTAIELSEIGMINDMRLLETISHNLANANTPGYKRDIAVTLEFENLLSTQLGTQLSGFAAGERQIAPAVQLLVDHAAGALQQTGNPLDLAIEGDAFFEVLTEFGTRYSRLGAFGIDGVGRLVDSHGFAIAGVDGDILLSGGDVTIDRGGSVFENGEYAGQLKLVAFEDPSLLVKEGRRLLRASDEAIVRTDNDSSVRQGYREASNVEVMQEMVRLVTTLRHFETTSRVLKGYDDMVDTAISTIAEF